MLDAGFNVILGIDNWKDAIDTFNYNHKKSKGLVADLNYESPEIISKKTGIRQVDIIIGGPPCQGFSIAGKRIIEDERNDLYKCFVKFVDFYKPTAFLMENVPNLFSMGNGIIKDFEKIGYTVTINIIEFLQYGKVREYNRLVIVLFFWEVKQVNINRLGMQYRHFSKIKAYENEF